MKKQKIDFGTLPVALAIEGAGVCIEYLVHVSRFFRQIGKHGFS